MLCYVCKLLLNLNFTKGAAQMLQFLIVYLGGDQPFSPEEGKQHFSKYMHGY